MSYTHHQDLKLSVPIPNTGDFERPDQCPCVVYRRSRKPVLAAESSIALGIVLLRLGRSHGIADTLYIDVFVMVALTGFMGTRALA